MGNHRTISITSNCIMKRLPALLLGLLAVPVAFAMLWPLWPRSGHLSDRQIRNRMAGVWVSDAKPPKVIDNQADGTIVVRINGREQAAGTWQVRNGYLISTPAASSVSHPALTESNKVLMVTRDLAILLSIDGQTLLTFHRQ